MFLPKKLASINRHTIEISNNIRTQTPTPTRTLRFGATPTTYRTRPTPSNPCRVIRNTMKSENPAHQAKTHHTPTTQPRSVPAAFLRGNEEKHYAHPHPHATPHHPFVAHTINNPQNAPEHPSQWALGHDSGSHTSCDTNPSRRMSSRSFPVSTIHLRQSNGRGIRASNGGAWSVLRWKREAVLGKCGSPATSRGS